MRIQSVDKVRSESAGLCIMKSSKIAYRNGIITVSKQRGGIFYDDTKSG